MRKNFFAVFLFILGVGGLRAELIRCDKSFYAETATNRWSDRRYAPHRLVEIEHFRLEVIPDFNRRAVQGSATWRFKPVGKPLRVLSLDAVDLSVSSVTGTPAVASFQLGDDKLHIEFSRPIAVDEETTIRIEYQAHPRQGLYFRTAELGYLPEETHLWTQGEPEEARHWYPCYDSPNEKFTSEIICRVPEDMTVLSNGRLVSEVTEPGGRKTVHWHQDKPHVNYLIALVAGYFRRVEDRHGDVPLALYVPPRDLEYAANTFRETKQMMRFFEEEIGVAYPWAKYDQVCVRDYSWGGMENTSLTTLTDATLFSSDTENLRSSQGLVAHELAHQWFGDLVTCKDWSHIWLNEGFATYYAWLYDAHTNGIDSMRYGLYHEARSIVAQAADPKPVANRHFNNPIEQFNYRAYDKGSWILHMLRVQLGPDLFRKCVKTFVERHAYQTAVTDDLARIIEDLSGRSYDRFFDQWVYHAGLPELDAAYQWDAETKTAKVTLRQTQKLSESVMLFQFPLRLRFHFQDGPPVERDVEMAGAEEDFYFRLETAPEVVRFDPELSLLAKINFNPPVGMVRAQLALKDDVIGRLLALEHLGRRTDPDTVAQLAKVLGNDAFYGVRIAAADALATIHTVEALEALAASLDQPDARVRRQVIAGLGRFYRAAAFERIAAHLATEKNPDLIAQALESLARAPQARFGELAGRYLNTNSFRQRLAGAAFAALKTRDDPAWINPVRETLQRRSGEFPAPILVAGMGTLAHLARNEAQKDAVRDYLVSLLENKKRSVVTGALAALGVLGDPRAIPAVETYTHGRPGTTERTVAERALQQLRASQKPSENLAELRKSLFEVQQENREVRKELDELKKRLGAWATTNATLKATNAVPTKRGLRPKR